MVPFISSAQIGADAGGVSEAHWVPSLPDLPEPSMPSNTDRDPRHDARETHPKSSGVSVQVTGHPSPPPAAAILAREASGVPAYVTTDQVSAMVACAPTTRDRLLLRTLWESGGRVSEVASLRLCDIDRAEGPRQLTNLKQRGPRRHVKLVSISRDLAGALLAFARDTRLRHDGHHFGSRQSGAGLITRQQVLRIVNRLAVDAGVIVQGQTGPRPACGLDFRHGSAVHLLGSGVPLIRVGSHFGHACVDTTAVYLRLTNRDRCGQSLTASFGRQPASRLDDDDECAPLTWQASQKDRRRLACTGGAGLVR